MAKLFFLFFILPVISNAQINATSALDQYMNAQVKEFDFSGSVLIAQKGKIIFKKAFGLADREWNIRNTTRTKFKIGSISKQFTSAAVLQLIEKGSLNLQDKLSRYFPDFPKGDSVTIHMLLNHTSGIKDYYQALDVRRYRDLTVALTSRSRHKDSIVAYFKTTGYVFPPGTGYHYSNTGYVLLAYIVEKVTGQSLNTYMAANVFSKIGMTNTSVDVADSILSSRARGYEKTAGGWRNADYLPNELVIGTGSIISTIEDQYKWTKALHEGKVISNDLLAKMTTPYLSNYGYGLNILSLNGHKYIGHNGGFSGFSNQSDYYLGKDIYVVVLSNNTSAAGAISRALASIMLGMKVIPPYKHKAVTIDAKLLDKYVGKYMTSTTPLELVLINGKLFRRQQATKDVELIPESNTKFFYADGSDRQFNFIIDSKGKVLKAEVIRGGIAEEIKRLD